MTRRTRTRRPRASPPCSPRPITPGWAQSTTVGTSCPPPRRQARRAGALCLGRRGRCPASSPASVPHGLIDFAPADSRACSYQAALEPNHSHFVLVDTARPHTWGGEIALRVAMEKNISVKWVAARVSGQHRLIHALPPAAHRRVRSMPSLHCTRTSTDCSRLCLHRARCRYGVPMVTVVVGGGPNTVATVERALKSCCPVVLLVGTGGAADAIAAYLEWYQVRMLACLLASAGDLRWATAPCFRCRMCSMWPCTAECD